MDITVLSWMRNEEDIIPFFLRHYSFADRIIVWDNESTDRTRMFLKDDPRVEVRRWVTGGEMRDDELRKMKSEEYRKTGPGWKIIVDSDEFVFHPDIRGYLNRCDEVGITIPQTTGYDMVSDGMPLDDGMTLLTDAVRYGVLNPRYNKACVLKDCVKMEYGHGCHTIIRTEGPSYVSRESDLKLLHYRFLSEARVRRKAEEYKPSKANRDNGWGINNYDVEMMVSRWREAWKNKGRVI